MTSIKLVNIGGGDNDPGWRYKREVVQCRTEGANGLQIRMFNLKRISDQLVPSFLKGDDKRKMSDAIESKILSCLKKKYGMITKSRDDW